MPSSDADVGSGERGLLAERKMVLRAERTADAWSPVALTSLTWQAGAADCKATLDQLNDDAKVTMLASATFTAGA
jgi:hypothetical protein